MLSVFLCTKHFQSKKFAIYSKSPFVFKNQLLPKLIFPRGLTNRLFFTVSRPLQSPVSASTSIPIPANKSSEKDQFAVSYLINSCGLSRATAISASARVKFESPERPDSVLTLLRNHGFNKSETSDLVRRLPIILLSSPEKTLFPKLKFFESIFVSNTDLPRTLSRSPTLLKRSLEKQIIPFYNFLNSVLLSDEKVATAMKRYPWIFLQDYTKNIAPNIEVLRELKVPQSRIIFLVTHFPGAIVQKHDEFRETVIEVKNIGFDPLKTTFVSAVKALSGKSSKFIWKRCYETYTNWGWSKDEILLAFRKNPHCMILSDDKICRTMEFLLNKMGWQSGEIVRCPNILSLSLEKRIIPRCAVVQCLSLRGLLKKGVKLSSVLIPVEKRFLVLFVTKYEEELPELLEVYRGKLDASGIKI